MLSLRRNELRRAMLSSAAFRLTLRFAAIFVTCLLIFDVIGGLTARWYVERQTRAQVEDLIEEARRAFDFGGADALDGFLREAAEDIEDDGLAIGRQTAEGALLQGTLTLPRPEIGWVTFVPDGIDEDEALWVKSARLPDGTWLSAGASSEFYHDIGEFMLAGGAWPVAIGLPLGILSGALLSRAVLRRLAPIPA